MEKEEKNYLKESLIDCIIDKAFESGICSTVSQAQSLRDTVKSYDLETLKELSKEYDNNKC